VELSMKEVMELLNVRENEVVSYIKTRKLPAHKINHQFKFNKEELKEWVIRNGITVSEKFLDMNLIKTPVSISELIKKGGIFTGITGPDVKSILADAVLRMRLPSGINSAAVLASLIEREEMMPTAVGKGIAIPHPRNPIISDVENESISLCMLDKPADFHAMDGRNVHSMFVIISANSRRHLEILSKLLYLCQQADFTAMLEARSAEQEILAYVMEKEKMMKDRAK